MEVRFGGWKHQESNVFIRSSSVKSGGGGWGLDWRLCGLDYEVVVVCAFVFCSSQCMCPSRLTVMPNSSICSLFVSVWTVNLLSCTLVATGVGRVGRGEGWSRGDRGVAREENRVAASALTARPRKVYMYFFDPDRRKYVIFRSRSANPPENLT